MAGYRKNRVNEELMREVSAILRTVKDPRVSEAFVSITAVNCSPDLKYAKIYYSFLSKRYTEKDVRDGLKCASGYIRSCIAKQMNMRITPELTFVYDTSLQEGARINELLRSVGLGGTNRETDKQENDGQETKE